MNFEKEPTPKEKYERLVPLLIAGAGYSKDEENKIVREALADFLVGKTESTAIGGDVTGTQEDNTWLITS